MYPKAYIDFLVYFHGERDYFECHEVLEEHWKKDPRGQRKSYWVALIQIAVGLYHYRRENYDGAKRMLCNALNLTKKNTNTIDSLGLDTIKLVQQLEEVLNAIQNKEPYQSINLPIKDPKLLEHTKEKCFEKNCTFGTPSNLSNDFLVHKHTKRDREEVINERLRQLNVRKNK